MREKLFGFMLRVFKHEEGAMLSYPLLFLRFLLFPFQSWKYAHGYYCPVDDTFEIYGIRYSATLFRGLAFGKLGSEFRIVRREDGLITLEEIRDKGELNAKEETKEISEKRKEEKISEEASEETKRIV